MITVTLSIDGAKVTLTGPEDFVREEVRHLTGRLARSPAGHSAATEEASLVSASPGTVRSSLAEAKLVEEKRPANHSETVAVLAYCMRENGTKEFSEEDMRRAYLRAKVRPPKVVSQAIRDAKNSFDYVEPASAKGLYRLTHHGERTVVFDLPRG